MVDSADEPPLSTRLHSWARNKTASAPKSPALHTSLPKTSGQSSSAYEQSADNHRQDAGNSASAAGSATVPDSARARRPDTEQQITPAVDEKGEGTQPSAIGIPATEVKAPLVHRFLRDVKRIIRSSWINWLLIFVPVGIILGIVVEWADNHVVSPSVVFAINAVAIIPLASLLAFATESVAAKLGDTIGALLNVTFGNAVELIIFIIALQAKEVRVVQAAALGSILSNLLLILGMCFIAGGLRFREQLYNATVSQMSACLLCVSVISLLLPVSSSYFLGQWSLLIHH
jgi:Ca2+:H+ antiporter